MCSAQPLCPWYVALCRLEAIKLHKEPGNPCAGCCSCVGEPETLDPTSQSNIPGDAMNVSIPGKYGFRRKAEQRSSAVAAVWAQARSDPSSKLVVHANA